MKVITDGAGRSVATAEWIYDNARAVIGVVQLVTMALAAAAGFVLRSAIGKRCSRWTRRWGGSPRTHHDRGAGHGAVDEVGAVACAVLVFKEGMIAADQMRASGRGAAGEGAACRLHHGAGAGVRRGGKLCHRRWADAAGRMQATAGGLSSTVGQTGEQAMTVAAAAQQASANVQTVASAAEELTSSIYEISRQVALASQVSHKAVDQADRTNDIVGGLQQAARRIGEVIDTDQPDRQPDQPARAECDHRGRAGRR